jgi:hypothetical protein
VHRLLGVTETVARSLEAYRVVIPAAAQEVCTSSGAPQRPGKRMVRQFDQFLRRFGHPPWLLAADRGVSRTFAWNTANLHPALASQPEPGAEERPSSSVPRLARTPPDCRVALTQPAKPLYT